MNKQPVNGGAHESFTKLTLSALGVVLGNIGTSPLYAVQACFAHGLAPEPANVIGVISLILWSLTIVVSIKYALVIMRADNNGEGGVFSLLALAVRAARREAEKIHDLSPVVSEKKRSRARHYIMLIGMFGAALFLGDGMITPAISVLSAVEGLDVLTPKLQNFVMPVSIAILVGLFTLQRFGSQKIGNSFGPIMVAWFACLIATGVHMIAQAPDILEALNPLNAVTLIRSHGHLSFIILGSALLAFTGGEALFTDMGHFGQKPIRFAWYAIVMPALAINYLGQGALLLQKPEASSNPFYLLVPTALVLPLVALAAMATVIASQAVISGTFSIVRQAIQMDYLPRFSVVHTSALEHGQIYLPKVNAFLCVSVVMLVLLFRSSSALAGAYGFAVGGAMLVDTILTAYVARRVWHWAKLFVLLIFAPLMIFDLIFFTTATAKIPEGGWLPLSVGIIVLTIFVTWRQGRAAIHSLWKSKHAKLEAFVTKISPEWPLRSPGTSVYLAASTEIVPSALTSALNRYHTLRENVIVLTILKEDGSHVHEQHRATIHSMGKGFWRVVLHYGFMEEPNVAEDLRVCMKPHPGVRFDEVTFFLGHSIYVEGPYVMTPHWRKRLFLWLANNVEEDFLLARIPSEQLVQIGTQIEV